MSLKKCDYCGKEYDETQFGSLDNGSEACFRCISDEDELLSQRKALRENKTKEKK